MGFEAPTSLIGQCSTFGLTLLLLSSEAAVFSGLVTKLSDIHNSLESCDDRCLQFKVVADVSKIPATGIWPFVIKNGQTREEIVKNCIGAGAFACEALPDLSCEGRAADFCDRRSHQKKVLNPLKGSKAEYAFIASAVCFVLLTLVNDAGLQLGWVGHDDAVMFHCFSAIALFVMTSAALMWVSGVMELFFAEVEGEPQTCGCMYKVQDIPAILALSLPVILVTRSRSRLVNVMRAAIVSRSYISSMKYHVTYDLVQGAGIKPTGSLLGVRSLGESSQPDLEFKLSSASLRPLEEVGTPKRPPSSCFSPLHVKRLAKSLPFVAITFIMIPMLFTHGVLAYRVADLFVNLWNSFMPRDISHAGGGALGMIGVFGMVILQVGAVWFFVGETWTLMGILHLQIGKIRGETSCAGRAHIAKDFGRVHHELAWGFASVT